jgi:hypothetical protein
MFEDRSYKRTFYSAPQSVQSLIAAFLEPGLIVAVLLAALAWCDEPVARPVYVLCLLVFALTFPGRDRFLLHPVSAILDVLGSWLTLLAILAAFGYATNSLKYFEPDVLMFWAELPHEIERLGVREVYITLPLGSQPRIVVKLLENCRAPRPRSTSCPTCSASASSRAGCRT